MKGHGFPQGITRRDFFRRVDGARHSFLYLVVWPAG
jgi:hypothetical protein